MASSDKNTILEGLFHDPSRWDRGRLLRPVVTLSEVQAGIAAYNATALPGRELSDRNPANFFKDYVRRLSAAEKNWPESIRMAGYTAVQRTGGGDAFAFTPLAAGELGSGFCAGASRYPVDPETVKLAVQQTLGLDVFMKSLARTDEAWLQSMAAALQLPQAHLALHYNPQFPINQIGHAQSNMKLLKTEIDSFYYGRLPSDGVVLLPMEIKGISDDILESQLLEQVGAVQNLSAVSGLLNTLSANLGNTLIVPMALKVVSADCGDAVPGFDRWQVGNNRLMYMVHYKPIALTEPCPAELTLYGETLFDLRPGILGVNTGFRPRGPATPDQAGQVVDQLALFG